MADDINDLLGEYAEHPEIKGRVPDVQTLAKRFVDAQSEIGRRLRVPSPDAGDEDRAAFMEKLTKAVPNLTVIPAEGDTEGWAKFNAQLGVPEDPSGYTVPEGAEDIVNLLGKTAHGMGINNKQLNKLAEVLAGVRDQGKTSVVENKVATENALKKEWGDAFHDNMMYAKMWAKTIGMETEFNDNPLYAHSQAFLKAAAKSGRALAENEGISTQMAIASGGMSLSEAEARRNEIMNNKDHDYHHQFRSGYKQAEQEMLDLNRMIAKLKDRG